MSERKNFELNKKQASNHLSKIASIVKRILLCDRGLQCDFISGGCNTHLSVDNVQHQV